MMSLKAIRNALIDRRINLVSKATNLHYNTIREVRDNPEANPTYSTIKALSDYLLSSHKEPSQ